MVKTTTTITLDADLKDVALPILQNDMRTSLSRFVNEKLLEIVKKKQGEKNAG